MMVTGTNPLDDDIEGSGTQVSDVPCLYRDSHRLIESLTIVSEPTLRVAPSDPLKVGDTVENIADRDGVIIHAGPLRVEHGDQITVNGQLVGRRFGLVTADIRPEG